jgi:methionyl-tRNA formyltransferase
MKLIYFGTASFAVPALRALAEDIVLVVTQPDRPSGRGMRLQASSVKVVAEELGLRIETPEKSRDPDFVSLLRTLAADALVVAAYGQILSIPVLESARMGGINLHGSILPKYRGAAPIQRCILNGDTETGATLMQMDRGMDTGDIIAISRTAIGPDETYGELQERLAVIAADMAVAWLPRIVAGAYDRRPQDDSQATIAPKVTKAEAELSFSRSAGSEYNRCRAFTPAPGAFIQTRFGSVKIRTARLGTEVGPAGVVISVADSCQLGFTNGSIHLLEVQPEGKKRMTGKDFANGLRLRIGDSLL